MPKNNRERQMVEELRMVLRLYSGSVITLEQAKEATWKIIWSGEHHLKTH